MNKKTLDKLQEYAGDVCVFLGMNVCKKEDLTPEYCIHGDYELCSKYREIYKAYEKKELNERAMQFERR